MINIFIDIPLFYEGICTKLFRNIYYRYGNMYTQFTHAPWQAFWFKQTHLYICSSRREKKTEDPTEQDVQTAGV